MYNKYIFHNKFVLNVLSYVYPIFEYDKTDKLITLQNNIIILPDITHLLLRVVPFKSMEEI